MTAVFISYQTRTHKEYIPAIQQVLSEAGLSVWVDEQNPVPGLRAEGLDAGLQTGLRHSDVLLFLVPRPGRQMSWMQKILEGMDIFSSLLSREYGGTPHAGFYWLNIRYNRDFYGLQLDKLLDESWQQWEKRVGEQLGLTVVSLAIQAAGEEPFEAAEGGLSVAAENLEQELRQKVVPVLLQAPPRQPPKMLPERASLLEMLKSFFIYLLVFAALAVLVVLALIVLLIYLFQWKAVLVLVGIAALLALKRYGPRAAGWLRARMGRTRP